MHGIRLTCSYIKDPMATVIIGEKYCWDPVNVSHIGRWGGTTSVASNREVSPHFTYSLPQYKGNYVFLDGHVSWMERLASDQNFLPKPVGSPDPPCP